jgi:hypothetical protein
MNFDITEEYSDWPANAGWSPVTADAGSLPPQRRNEICMKVKHWVAKLQRL